MARGVNKVIIVGNCGQDPETRFMPSGGAVTNSQYCYIRVMEGQNYWRASRSALSGTAWYFLTVSQR